jgi:hypothetical protein
MMIIKLKLKVKSRPSPFQTFEFSYLSSSSPPQLIQTFLDVQWMAWHHTILLGHPMCSVEIVIITTFDPRLYHFVRDKEC